MPHLTTLNAPLTPDEERDITRVLDEVLHYVSGISPETSPLELLGHSTKIIDLGFRLRASIEAAFGAANRRAHAPGPKPWSRGVNPYSKPDKGAQDLEKLVGDMDFDALVAALKLFQEKSK